MWKGSVKIDKPVSHPDGDESSRDLGDTSMIPSLELDRKRRAALIRNAVSRLPAIHRELVVLRDFQELSYEEIEVITGISPGTIKSRLARARAALQKELKGLHDES